MTASLSPAAEVSSRDASVEHGARQSRWLARSIAFLAGFQIMVLEMAGLRVVQTSFGSSVVVTGTTIALVMVILAFGYAVGGRVARPDSPRLILSGALTLVGLYSQFIAVASCDAIAAWGFSLREQLQPHPALQSVLPTVIVFNVLYGLPTFLLGAVTPYLIGSANTDRGGDIGVEAGTVMAVSTAGSIAGTAFSSYLAIPILGVAATVANASAVVLAAAALSALNRCHSRAQQGSLLIAALVIALVTRAAAMDLARGPGDPSTIYQAESHYGQLRVVKGTDAAGRDILQYYPSRLYTHSWLHIDDPLRATNSLMYLVPGLISSPRDVLVLGSAAGAALKRVEVAFPDARAVGVDLDPAVHKVATEIFGVDSQRSQLVTSDARLFLVNDERRYDLIMIDLFAGEFIPAHCLSLEFFELVARRLSPSGAVFINTNMNDVPFELPRDEEPFRPIRHLQSTLRAAGFPSVMENTFYHSLFAFREPRSVESFRTSLFAALRRPDLNPALRVGAGVAAYTTTRVPDWGDRYRPLTDSWMPTPLLERKSNRDAIYAALVQTLATRRKPVHEPLNEVERLVLQEHVLAGSTGRIRRLDPLYSALNTVDDARLAIDLDTAGRMFRFSQQRAPSTVQPVNAWARLAAAYSDIYALGWNDEQEQLLELLLSLTHSLTDPGASGRAAPSPSLEMP